MAVESSNLRGTIGMVMKIEGLGGSKHFVKVFTKSGLEGRFRSVAQRLGIRGRSPRHP